MQILRKMFKNLENVCRIRLGNRAFSSLCQLRLRPVFYEKISCEKSVFWRVKKCFVSSFGLNVFRNIEFGVRSLGSKMVCVLKRAR